jgi:hypothetical protein
MVDTALCPDCEEVVVDGYQYHPGCCPHDEVEPYDEGDTRHYCQECGARVVRTTTEHDNVWSWEVAD